MQSADLSQQIADARARLAEAERIAYGLAERVIKHGERALRRERRKSERRELAKSIRKLRRAVEHRPAVTVTVPPHPSERRVPLRIVTQPIQRGAP